LNNFIMKLFVIYTLKKYRFFEAIKEKAEKVIYSADDTTK